VAVRFERLVEHGEETLGEVGRLRRLVHRRLHDGEFVAAEPRHGVGLADPLGQPAGHRL